MKRHLCFVILLLTTIAMYGQDTGYQPIWNTISGYEGLQDALGAGHTFRVYMQWDKATTNALPYNRLDDRTNLSYLMDTRSIKLRAQITFDCSPADFRYRIVENDTTELVPWSQLPDTDLLIDSSESISFKPVDKSAADLSTTFKILRRIIELGTYNCENKQLTLQLYWVKRPNDISTSIINTKPISKPRVYVLKRVIQESTPKLSEVAEVIYLTPEEARSSIGVRYSDTLTVNTAGSDLTLKLYADNLSQINSILLKRIINGKTDSVAISSKWTQVSHTIFTSVPDSLRRKDVFSYVGYKGVTSLWETKIDRSFITQPGDYELIITPDANDKYLKNLIGKDKVTSIHFTVLPSYKIAFSAKQVAVITAIPILLASLFFWRYRRKLRTVTRQKDKARLQLASVRAQLNPHFMFNALTGIQNLMNKQETDKAYHYLGKFARLTRSVLDEADQEMIPIEEECKFLDDYLQMEQLRFGFHYEIHADKTLYAVEIPVMLLQPFVENAVKHGVAELKDKGDIQLHFMAEEKDLVIQIADNGAGVIPEQRSTGMGLKLSKDRITLLNTLYRDTPLELNILNGDPGVIIHITLHKWL